MFHKGVDHKLNKNKIIFIVKKVYVGAPNGSFRRNICSAGLYRLRYSDFFATKTRAFL